MTIPTDQKSSEAPSSPGALSPRKRVIRELFDRLAPERDHWIRQNSYFYDQDRAYMRFLIPKGLRVLELGCGTGQLLAALEPSFGLGLDLSPEMVRQARLTHPTLEFREGDIEDQAVAQALDQTFDVIVLSDTIGLLDDCQQALENLHCLCTPRTRVVIAYYSHAWEPLLRVAEKLGRKMPQVEQNWLSTEDITALLQLADFEPIKREWRTLIPKRAFGAGSIINRFVAPLPLLRRLCLRNYVVARPRCIPAPNRLSTTVLIPCRNERGNVEAAVRRIPDFCSDLEILFVEGHSQDGTLDEIHRVIEAYPEHNIRVLQQPGKGKGDAVRFGFTNARGEVLMILDGDLTVPPEALPKFYEALANGKGEFINGTRLVYPMEDEAMRFLNEVANHAFSDIFTWLLNQRITDTLCGTKVLTKAAYAQIAANRSYFGDFDPFGDFDLILGAAKLNLKILEMPVRYAARTYGTTQISRFRHGWLLLRMVVFAFRKLKAL